ncbi:MAG: hypothetical protein LAT50_16915 [Ectothiorhodospiraceae bacterium]|nr:hypothetical protein [Ectothiorhodospiraceae bacterium]
MQQQESTQREMALLGSVKPIEDVPMALVTRCRTARDALRLCVQYSGAKHAYIAESLGMGPAQFSKIMSGSAHLDEDLREPMMQVCGNRAPLQWMAWRMGRKLVVDDRADEIARLERQLTELKGAA